MPAQYRASAPTYHTTMSTIGPGWTPADLRQLAYERQARLRAGGIGQGPFDKIPGAGGIAAAATEFAQGAVRSVRIESQVTPPYVYTPGVGGRARAEPGITDWIMRNVIRPVVIVDTPIGQQVYAPHGVPQWNLFWPLVGLAAGGAVLVGVLAVRGIRAPRAANPRKRRGKGRRR